MKKKTKLGVAIASAVMAAAMVVPAAMAGSFPSGGLTSADSTLGNAPSSYRFIVKYRDGAAEAKDAAVVNRELGAAVNRAGLVSTVGARGASTSKSGAVTAKLLRRMAAPGWSVVSTSRGLNAAEAANFMRELKADPAVERVEIDQLYQRMVTDNPAMVPNDPDYARLQWNLHNAVGGVRAEGGWDISTGEGVVVAVLDTGIVENHADLAANVIPGYDMLSDKRLSRRDTDDRVPGGWDVGDWVEADYCTGWAVNGSHPADNSSWHGSHVAGTIAQQTNNSVGVAGLAHGARVMPVRVLGSCGGFGADIADGIVWAAGGTVPGLPVNPNPAEVINMSLGSRGPAACPTIYQDAIDTAIGLGAIIVVAAGNANSDAGSRTMSSCNSVITVGSTRVTGGKSSFSNFGPAVDISAPGGDIDFDGNPNGGIWQVLNSGTTRPTTSWVTRGYEGTSMASPHVAAAVAMVQSVVDTPLTWTQMESLLKQTARPFPVAIAASTPMGAGILDVQALLTKATTPPCDPAVDDCGPEGTPLVNKVAVNGLAGGAGSETLYSFEAEAGKTLTFMTYGGTGDVSMYVSFEAEPTAASNEAKSTRAGNSETVRINKPKAGVYYVKLVGAKSYTGVSLVARQ